MSMRGGYQIIDLDNFKFSSSDENYNIYRNMYYNLLNSNAKLILLSGLYMDNSQYSDMDVIFYETDMEDSYPTFQAVLRITWNTTAHTCTTRYVNIASNDNGEKNSWKDAKVWLSSNTIIYEDVDQALDILSSKAIANKVVTKNINRLDEEDTTFLKLDGSREMTGSLVLPQVSSGEKSITQSGSVFRVNNKSGGPVIFDGVATPASNEHGANKKYVDDKIESITPPIYDETDIETNDVNNKAEFHSNGVMFTIIINVASSFTTCTFSINSQSIIDYYNTIKGTNEDSISIKAMAISGAYNESGTFGNLTAECDITFAKSTLTTDITITQTNYGVTTSIRNYYITGFLY